MDVPLLEKHAMATPLQPAAINATKERLERFGQTEVLRFWDQLTPEQQTQFGSQLAAVDLAQLKQLYQEAAQPPVAPIAPTPLNPEHVVRLPTTFEDWERDQAFLTKGEEVLRAGQVAIVLVAGGQGTRLGFDGPKGTFPITPITKKTLFQVHSEKVLALSRRYAKPLPIYVMTSPENDAATRAFFAEYQYFGLPAAQVTFFEQGTMPAVDQATGKMLLAQPDALALSPNGHGGVLQALADGGHLDQLARQGVAYLFYFQVDNPLVKIADPTYLGAHVSAGAEMSLKVIPKLNPGERVGVVAEQGGKLGVIEYSDLPQQLAEQTDPDGQLTYWAGSIAIHVFNVAFLRRLATKGTLLPFHRAFKKVPYVDQAGQVVEPTQPQAYKFEMFVFDALPLAEKALVVETSRKEEFEPLKNATGENSPASVQQAMTSLYAEWLEHAGHRVPTSAPIEISPLYALDAEELRSRLPAAALLPQPLVLDKNTGNLPLVAEETDD